MNVSSARIAASLVILSALPPIRASAQPVLSVNPTAVSMTAEVGQPLPSQTVQVTKSGPSALKWSVTTEQFTQPGLTLTVSPTSGTNAGTLTVSVSYTSSVGAGNYAAAFVVSASGNTPQRVPVSVVLTASSPPPPPPPDGWTFCANENGFCAFSGTKDVRYGANNTYAFGTFTDGVACTNAVFGDPIVGVVKHCDVKDATTPPPPPPPTGVGPQAGITCPSGAIDVFPTDNIQTLVNAFPGTTTFCLNPGVYPLRGPIIPKTGNTFVGEYGAILDGTGWVTADPNTGAFLSYKQDIDDVTIKNLVIRYMPQRAIFASADASNRWTVVNNELANSDIGIAAPNDSTVANNSVHHNATGGYNAFGSANTVFDHNEFAYNGNQKLVGATNVSFTNNFVHHNADDGIWYDTSVGGIVEGNVVEDSGRDGISAEASRNIVIRNNTVRRSADTGIFMSMSQGIQAYSNTVVGNFRAITYFVNCDALPAGLDLANNVVRDNTITVGTELGALANSLGTKGSCTPTQVEPYLNGTTKNNQFLRNSYSVPSLTIKYFGWGFGSASLRSWSEWQALGNDVAGTFVQY
jgi:parallel beta-helix repeat protein